MHNVRTNEKLPEDAGAPEQSWQRPIALACFGVFILLLIAFLYFGRSLLAPVATAALFSLLFGPVAARAEKYGIPDVLFAVACVVLAVIAANAILYGLAKVVANWSANAKEIGAAFGTALGIFERPLAAWQELRQSLTSLLGASPEPIKLDLPAGGILAATLTYLTPAVGELLIFFGCLFFFLVSRKGTRRFLVLMTGDQEARLRTLRILNEIEFNLVRYFGAVTVVNAALGVVTTAILYAVGLPDPALWGFVAFLLNYIPYIGPAIVLVILLIQGLVAFSSFEVAFIAPAAFLVVTTLEGHFITPSLVGKRLTMSPLAMFLSLAFWTWLWGPLGTFIAMPFLIAMTVIYNNTIADDKLTLPG